MCTVRLPPGDNPIAVNKYIYLISFLTELSLKMVNKAKQWKRIYNEIKQWIVSIFQYMYRTSVTIIQIIQSDCCNIYIYIYIYIYTGCSRRNVPNFGRLFLMLKYTDITQNTYVQIWMVTEIMAREVWNFDSCYTLIDYQIHVKTGRNMWFL